MILYKPEINIFHHPTTTVFVDDNSDFLYSIALGVDRLPYRSFNNPEAGLKYVDSFSSQYYAQEISSPVYTQFSALTNRILAQSRAKLHNPNRFAEPSVLVVDYSMPKLNGLDLCAQIVNPYIKKVLLTGVADEKVAIEALNTETIDFYISKNETSLSQRLGNIINHLENRYFQDLFGWSKDSGVRNDLPFLFDAGFADYFEDCCEQLEVIEHYPIADPLGLNLVNRYGQLSQLLVLTDSMLLKLGEFAQNQGLSSTVVQQIQRRERTIYPTFARPSSAKLFPLTAIRGNSNYFCCLIDHEHLSEESGRIALVDHHSSYNDFLQTPSMKLH